MAVIQQGTGPGQIAQGHAGLEKPQVQSSAGPEALQPPGLKSQVQEGRAASSWSQATGTQESN